MDQEGNHRKLPNMVRRLSKTLCIMYLFFMAIFTLFVFVCDLYWNNEGTIYQFLFKRVLLTVACFLLNLFFIYYFTTICKIKPFKEYTMWEICKETIHLKHILFWFLLFINFQMMVIIDSMRENNSSSFYQHYSYSLFVVSSVYHFVHYFLIYYSRIIDVTPELTTRSKPSLREYLSCLVGSVKTSLLCLFILKCILPISFIPTFINLFLLSLLHGSSEYIFKSCLQADISLQETLSPQTADVKGLLASISSSLSHHYYLRNSNNSLSDIKQDSLLYLAKKIEQFEPFNKALLSYDWRERYQSLQAAYELFYTEVSSNQLIRERYPVVSSLDRMNYHLQLKLFNALLRVAPQQALHEFVYTSDSFVHYCNAISSILINTTLQNQMAVKQFREESPASKRRWRKYLEICNSDHRRVVYCIQSMCLLIRRLPTINLFFEHVVFVWMLIVLSLWKSVKEQEQIITNEKNQGNEDVDRSIVLDMIDDFLYLVFNCQHINLREFSIPSEFAFIVDKYTN